jgi:hypothetical protein
MFLPFEDHSDGSVYIEVPSNKILMIWHCDGTNAYHAKPAEDIQFSPLLVFGLLPASLALDTNPTTALLAIPRKAAEIALNSYLLA